MNLTIYEGDVPLEIEGTYYEAESATFDSPGNDPFFELNEIKVGAHSIYDILDGLHYRTKNGWYKSYLAYLEERCVEDIHLFDRCAVDELDGRKVEDEKEYRKELTFD